MITLLVKVAAAGTSCEVLALLRSVTAAVLRRPDTVRAEGTRGNGDAGKTREVGGSGSRIPTLRRSEDEEAEVARGQQRDPDGCAAGRVQI